LEVLGLVLMLWQGAELILLLWQVVELLWFFVLRLLRLFVRPQNLVETHKINFQKKEARFFTGFQRLARLYLRQLPEDFHLTLRRSKQFV
jgi:hypothetical protein